MKMKGLLVAVVAACTFASATASAASSVYVRFKQTNGAYLSSQTQMGSKPGWEITESFLSSVTQTLNIGSVSSGAGAGKVAFNDMTITMQPSSLDPQLFTMACSGTPFEQVDVEVLNGNAVVELFHYKLVAVKSVAWVIDKATGNLAVQYTFEYGGMQVVTPTPGGKTFASGWDRIKNILSIPTDLAIP